MGNLEEIIIAIRSLTKFNIYKKNIPYTTLHIIIMSLRWLYKFKCNQNIKTKIKIKYWILRPFGR